MLNQLDDNCILPFHVEHILPSSAGDTLTSCYDSSTPLKLESALSVPKNAITPFQNGVITDIDAHAPSNELWAAAIRHVKKKGGGYIEILNQLMSFSILMIYPTLFPFGIGGFKDQNRVSKVSMKWHVKHLFNLADHSFQEHYSFLFTTFNILQ